MSFIGIILIILMIFLSAFLPIGNENSTVRRLPWITFILIGLNVIIFYGTLPRVAEDQKAFAKVAVKLEQFLIEHPEVLANNEAREKMVDSGLISKEQEEMIESQLKMLEGMGAFASSGSLDADVQKELDQHLESLQTARQESLWYKYGFAPNGEWQLHQLITAAFLHVDFSHLFGNMIIFFAIAFTLEDLWGRGVFLGFYLLSAAASCIPSIFSPLPLVGIGASGAISATMGAFLVRLPKAKIKLFIIPYWFLRWIMGAKKFTILIPGYVYLVAFFLFNVLMIIVLKKTGGVSNVGFAVHIAGFVFGAGFAAMMRASKVEETYIHPKLEAKVSFSAPAEVTDALDLLDRGNIPMAERKLRGLLSRNPDYPEAILGLIQVYQRTNNYEQLNAMYARLIRYHLGKQDKEAALFAYDTLLQAFPENDVAARIPARDWIVICEYLRESEMNREASVEFERLLKAWPDDALAIRAAVQGAEAALAAHETKRALHLYEQAQSMNPPQPMRERIESGIEKCKRILDNRPNWAKQTPKAPTIYRGY